MATSAPSATPVIESPLGVISPTNQSGLISIITALAVCFVLVSFVIRVHVRRSNGPFKTDDIILTVATVLSCIQSALVFFEVNRGLGKADSLVNRADQLEKHKAFYANNILYILVLFLSKASIAFLYLRLTPNPKHVYTVWAILGGSAIWTVMSILLITIECSWRTSCANMFDRWLAIGIIDCITDVALVLMAVYLVRGLQIRRAQKGIVVGAFGTRLLVVPACALRLYYLNPSTLTSNRTMALSIVVVCTQLQLGYGVMAASIPCLKPFVAVYEKPVGDTSYSNTYYANRSGKSGKTDNSSASRSLKLKSLNSAFGQRSHVSITGPLSPVGPEGNFRPDAQGSYKATVSAPKAKRIKSDDAISRLSHESHGSQRLIIEQKTEYMVQYQHDSGSLGDGTSQHSGHGV